MAGTDYIINPVKATCLKYANKQQNGIQGYNDTCFGICAAFSGTYDTYAMDPQCTQACTDLIEQKRYEIFGVGHCDHQVPYRPVVWGEIPRYVPSLLRKGLKPEQALSTCMRLCETSSLSEDCKAACRVDFSAIEPKQQRETVELPGKDSGKDSGKEPEQNGRRMTILAILAIAGVILLFLLREKKTKRR